SPGPLRGAILACEVEPKRIWPSRVFIRDKCMPGPTFAPGVTRLSFARANVSMEPGDAVTVIIEPEGAEAGAKNSSLVRAVYQGESPFQGGSPGESIVCHVVQNDVAKTFGLEALAEAKKHVEAAKPHKPSRDQVQDLPKPLYDARRDLSRAALWIGWDSPDVIKQLDAMTKVERGWSKALDKMFRELEKKTPPLTDAIQLKGKELPSVKPYGLVCGEALRTRYGDRAKGRTIGPDECGLELLFESKADKEVSFSWSFGSIGSVHYPRWLVRSGDGAHVVEAVMIDGRLDESGSKPDLAVIVPPGKRAIILVGGKERDPKLGRDNVEAATLFQGYESFGDWFEMRTDLAR
ncbi:MAG: hypothetical protein HOV80_06515, partial [Polyangiaceae bacterium]|nr:hypothetical protein [Polyangiaceae bacterium]